MPQSFFPYGGVVGGRRGGSTRSPIKAAVGEMDFQPAAQVVGVGASSVPQPPAGPSLFIRTTAHGTGDGGSWANSGSWANLASFVSSLATISDTNRTIYIRADEGTYTGVAAQTLTAGGTHTNLLIVDNTGTFDSQFAAGTPWQRVNPALNWNPITIKGVDVNLNPLLAVLEGGRVYHGAKFVQPAPTMVSWNGQPARLDVPPTSAADGTGYGSSGGNCLNLANGVQDLRFSYLKFQHFEESFNRNTDVVVTNIEFDHCQYYDNRLFIDSIHDIGGFNGFWMHDFSGAVHSKACIDMRGRNNHHLYEDCFVDSWRITGDDFAIGFFADAIVDGTWVRCRSDNCSQSDNGANTGGYHNGDGWSLEGTAPAPTNVLVERLQLIDCEGRGHSDAAVDSKCTNLQVIRFTARDCKKNFRFWNETHFKDTISIDPYKRGGTSATNFYYFTTAGLQFFGTNPTVSGSGGSAYGVNDGAIANISSANGPTDVAVTGTPAGSVNFS